jgi:carbamoyltransferase
MQYVLPLRQELRHNPPSNYNSLTQAEKLAVKRSNIPAVTHLDYTARLQTISQEKHPLFHQLLSKFKEKTGVGVILNTSFNVRGEPIVCTPLEAINCFRKTKIDVLVMGLSVFLRTAKEE